MREVNSLAAELKGVFGWHQARVVLLAQFMLSLIKIRSSNLVAVSRAFCGSSHPDSSYKRLQRFLRGFDIDYEQYAKVIAKWFLLDEKWVLTLDRTNWEFGKVHINYLVLGVARNGIAIPLFWRLLPKKGNSSTEERKQLINRFLAVFEVEKIAYLTADREFRGKDWLQYLVDNKIPFCLRIPNNTKVWNKQKNKKLPVSRLFSLSLGEQMHLNRPRKIWGITVHLSCAAGPKGRVIVASNERSSDTIDKYRVRWTIETLFGCLKRRGFDLEKTHLIHIERLEKLFMVLSLTFSWCFEVGIWQNSLNPIHLKKHGRKFKSIFRYGIDYISRILVNFRSNADEFSQVLRFLSCT